MMNPFVEALERAERLIRDKDAEIKRLRAALDDEVRLSHNWVKKHNRLLGFIQDRPDMLKELIAQDSIEQLGDDHGNEMRAAFVAFLDDYWPLWRQHEGEMRWHDLKRAFEAGWKSA